MTFRLTVENLLEISQLDSHCIQEKYKISFEFLLEQIFFVNHDYRSVPVRFDWKPHRGSTVTDFFVYKMTLKFLKTQFRSHSLF